MMSDPQTITRAIHLMIVSVAWKELQITARPTLRKTLIFVVDARVIKHHADAKGEDEGLPISIFPAHSIFSI